jgi:hypothetical protein
VWWKGFADNCQPAFDRWMRSKSIPVGLPQGNSRHIRPMRPCPDDHPWLTACKDAVSWCFAEKNVEGIGKFDMGIPAPKCSYQGTRTPQTRILSRSIVFVRIPVIARQCFEVRVACRGCDYGDLSNLKEYRMQIAGIRCCLGKRAACPGLLTGVILDGAIPFARGGDRKRHILQYYFPLLQTK